MEECLLVGKINFHVKSKYMCQNVLQWIYLQHVCTRILGGDRDAEPEAREWVKEMLHYFDKIGTSMTLKLMSKENGFTKPQCPWKNGTKAKNSTHCLQR